VYVYGVSLKGFLLAWVIHHKELWSINYELSMEVLLNVLKKYLPNKQPRWLQCLALIFYTKCLVCWVFLLIWWK